MGSNPAVQHGIKRPNNRSPNAARPTCLFECIGQLRWIQLESAGEPPTPPTTAWFAARWRSRDFPRQAPSGGIRHQHGPCIRNSTGPSRTTSGRRVAALKGPQRVAGGSAAAVPPERVPEHGQNPERGSRGSGCIVPRTESEAVSPQPVDRRREGSLVRVTCAIAESRVEFLAIQRTTSDYLRRHHFPVMSTSDGRESPASSEVVSLVPRAVRRVFQRVEIRRRHQGPHPSLCMALSATDSKPIVRVTPVRALGRGLSVSFFPVSPATSLR